jgi:osmotically-inducible protein OsmY
VRSDERIKETICARLTQAPHIDASEISLEVKQGEVTLTGSVPDRRTKFGVEEVVASCSGVTEIHNQLRIATTTQGGYRSNTQNSSSSS